jgi:hypothetical protein
MDPRLRGGDREERFLAELPPFGETSRNDETFGFPPEPVPAQAGTGTTKEKRLREDDKRGLGWQSLERLTG